MPLINQLQMQIHQAFVPDFTIKGWLHAKHLARHYSREQQLRSANLLLAIDKYLDPQLLLMETIWLVPEKGQSGGQEGEQHVLFSPPLLQPPSQKTSSDLEAGAGTGAGGRRVELAGSSGGSSETNPSLLSLRGQWGGSALSAASGRACSPSLLTALLLKGKPVC